jgi:hypothetical protein
MATISHEPTTVARRRSWFEARNMWASIAITAIWLAVVCTAIFGPDFRSIDAGGTSTTIPSGIAVALFAVFATMSVAKHGFEKNSKDD